MKLHTFVLFFTFSSSIAAFSLPYGLNEFKNNSNLPSIVQNSVPKDTCSTAVPHCEDSGGKCAFDQSQTAKCSCPTGTEYDTKVGCKVSEGTCEIEYCEETGGTCLSNKHFDIQCNCPEGTHYENDYGCKVSEISCKKLTYCTETGGKCKSLKTKGIHCECGDAIEYNNTLGCKVPKDTCSTAVPHCEITGGKCIFDQSQTAKCSCPTGSDYDKKVGCKAEQCDKAKCTNKCNCCPGYGIRKTWMSWFNGGECIKCNCGKNFGCEVNADSKTCLCPLGYSEKSGKCKADCKKNPCQNNGRCIVKNDDIVCNCKKPYTGELCEKVKCEKDSECKNGGSCRENGSVKTCKCLDGVGGPFCEEISDCDTIKCGTDAACVYDNLLKGGKCECNDKKKTFDSSDMECKNKCEKDSECKNGGSCIENGSVKTCQCLDGVGGPFCEEVSDCDTLNCGMDAVCVYDSLLKGGKCECNDKEKTFDPSDIECKSKCEKDSECKNGGSCIENGSVRTCKCLDGVGGPFCDDIKDCETINCGTDAACVYDNLLKDGKCECNEKKKTFDSSDMECKSKCEKDSECKNGGSCIENGSVKTCKCLDRVGGPFCDDIKDCDTINCGTDAACVYDSLLKGGKCECNDKKKTFDPSDKECKNKCSNVTCQNGGKCIIKGGKAACNCTDKYTGIFCETGLTSLNDSGDDIFISVFFKNRSLSTDSKFDFHFSRKEISNRTITELLLRLNSRSVARPSDDKCSIISCRNGGTCEVKNEKAACSCTDEYTGDYCEKSKCSLIKCQNGGNCQLNNGKAMCTCPDNYYGEYCENHECSLNKCKNGGKCEIKNGNAVCICPDRYTGNHCETDKCSLVPCKNGGRCDIVNGSARCICHDNYTGDSCETDKCSLIRCHNGGKCDVKNGEAVCMCNDEHIGDFCEIDKCSLIRCMNGGKCEIKNQKAVCGCNHKFTGDYCEKRIH